MFHADLLFQPLLEFREERIGVSRQSLLHFSVERKHFLAGAREHRAAAAAAAS
jgi:hypothetical protein